ncbi:MAG TPA: glycosyltransferase [Rhizomicrobium sp.]|jgi:glycosyltransferase involved in cell wall biosynthesis
MISVVIPTLDAAETLPDCLAALAAASASALVSEVIVADGGSGDYTLP